HGDMRAKRRNLTNLIFLQVDAIQFLKEVVPDNSVAGFHMYCPDPWNKRRHMKRRMINTEFLTLIANKTLVDSSFIITTDRADYFEEITEAIKTVTDLWICKHSQTLTNELKTEAVLTNFEIKYLEEGRDVFFLELIRRKRL
ncbi:MAG: tRNA (guanine-N7-)-methyltransferase, partial [Candidatus Omnitrophota bacterium]